MIATMPHRGPTPSTWRRVASYGVLWGFASVAVESFALPLGALRAVEVAGFLLTIIVLWCVTGVLVAGVLTLFGRRPGSAAIAMAVSTSMPLLAQAPIFYPKPLWVLADPLHLVWGGFIYGGLFVLAYRLHERSERIRGVLANAEIARQRTEALFSAEQLKVMQGQVDPALLLRVMTEVENRYGRDQAGADRLLDALVAFLRDAMPGVRSGASTLLAEVGLVRAYARLLAEIDPGRGRWRIDVAATVPDGPFPPLLLLPVLDRLAAGATQGIVLELRHGDGRSILSLWRSVRCDEGWLGSELDYRLRVGLRATLGDAWWLEVGNGVTSPAFVLGLATPDSPPSLNRPVEEPHGQDTRLL